MPASAAVRKPAVKRVTQRAPEGLVVAVVAVTGVKDHVGDVILPGSFRRTLLIRRPKVVFHHQWTEFAGRVLHIEELLPGDPRLPKTLKDGKPWPAEAGAVVATMQLNMANQKARDVFEWIRFYHESNECEFSIGYKVVPGKATRRRDGARVIHDLDVFEVSLVLFGAASETMSLEVKAAIEAKSLYHAALHQGHLGAATVALMEAKALGPAEDPAEDTVTHAGVVVRARDTGRVLLLQRALDADDPAGGTWEFPGGGRDAGESPWDAAVREFGEEVGTKLPEGELVDSWDSPNGIYRAHLFEVPTEQHVAINTSRTDRHVVNPDDPHQSTREPVAWWHVRDVRKLPTLRRECQKTPWARLTRRTWKDAAMAGRMEGKAAVAEARSLASGMEGKYNTGPVGSPGDRENWVDQVGGLPPFMRAVAHALIREGHEESEAIEMAVGTIRRWASGGGDVTEKTRAKAAKTIAEWDAKRAKAKADNGMEGKSMDAPAGSFEQVQDLIRCAARELFGKGEGEKDGFWVGLRATYPDRVIVDVDGEPGETSRTFEVPYTVTGGQVSLGQPVEVQLSVVVTPADGEEPEPVVDSEAELVATVEPAVGMLNDVGGWLRRTRKLEGKALQDAVGGAVLDLLDTLAVRGVDVAGLVLGDELEGKSWAGPGEDEEDEDPDEPDPDVEEDEEDEEAPAGPPATTPEEAEEEDREKMEGKGLVSYDPDEFAALQAQLEVLSL